MTPDEQLRHEEHIARVLAIRGPARGQSSLHQWLNSAVVTTLIGVAGTGVVGALISGRIQERARQNELSVASAKEAQAARVEIVGRILEVVGRNLSATDDLLVTVSNAYAADRIPEAERPKLAQWKQSLAERRDKSDSEWREVRRNLGFSLLYRFNGDTDIATRWQAIIAASDAFERCTNAWYSANARIGSDEPAAKVCAKERTDYETATEHLVATAAAH